MTSRGVRRRQCAIVGVAIILLPLLGLEALPATGLVAAADECAAESDMQRVRGACGGGDDGGGDGGGGDGDGPPISYVLYADCDDNDCTQLSCLTPDGRRGLRHLVYRGEEQVGTDCLAPGEEQERVLTPGDVQRAFEGLSWPGAVLSVEPPRGRVPVNFDVYFFTERDGPVTRSVTLLGQRVVIEARPSEFVWDFGDGSGRRTSGAGGPFPDGDVVHRYLELGRVAPSVDVVYAGRYRVNGGGWVVIPATVRVAGSSSGQDVIAVDLELVAPGGTGGAGRSSYECRTYC